MICEACGKETQRYIIDTSGRALSPSCYWKAHPNPVPAVCDACGRRVQWSIPHRGGRYGETCYLQIRDR
jgi:hypothetical protein